MALYLIEHRHTPETCPTRDPNMVRQLRAHVSDENAARLGVSILGDWANEPDHHVVFIVDGPYESVQHLAAPFAQMGETTVTPGLTCEDTARECLGE
jgi:hypothetical protein